MNRFFAVAALLGLTTVAHPAVDPTAFAAAVDLYTQHKPVEAQQAFAALAVAAPDNADVHFYLGRLALQRNDHEQAVASLEKAVALAPDDARMHLRLGDAYGLSAQKAGLFSKMGLAGKCKTEYEKAVGLDGKNIEARSSLMAFYLQAPGIAGGSTEKALEQAGEIKKLDLNRGRFAFATVYAADKKFDLAFAEYEEALQAAPDNAAVLYQLGKLSATSGERLDRGLAALRQCITLAPPGSTTQLAAVHWRIGNILEKQGDKTGARAAYEKAVQTDPAFKPAAESLKKLN